MASGTAGPHQSSRQGWAFPVPRPLWLPHGLEALTRLLPRAAGGKRPRLCWGPAKASFFLASPGLGPESPMVKASGWLDPSWGLGDGVSSRHPALAGGQATPRWLLPVCHLPVCGAEHVTAPCALLDQPRTPQTQPRAGLVPLRTLDTESPTEAGAGGGHSSVLKGIWALAGGTRTQVQSVPGILTSWRTRGEGAEPLADVADEAQLVPCVGGGMRLPLGPPVLGCGVLGSVSAQTAGAGLADSGSSRDTEDTAEGESMGGPSVLGWPVAGGSAWDACAGACPVRACQECMECACVAPACTPRASPRPACPSSASPQSRPLWPVLPVWEGVTPGSIGPLAVLQAAPTSLTS